MKFFVVLMICLVGCSGVQDCMVPCLTDAFAKDFGLDKITKDKLIAYFEEYTKQDIAEDQKIKADIKRIIPKSKSGEDELLNLGIDLGLRYFLCMLECSMDADEKSMAKQKILQFDRME